MYSAHTWRKNALLCWSIVKYILVLGVSLVVTSSHLSLGTQGSFIYFLSILLILCWWVNKLNRIDFPYKQSVSTEWSCHSQLPRMSTTKTVTSIYKGHVRTSQKYVKTLVPPHQRQKVSSTPLMSNNHAKQLKTQQSSHCTSSSSGTLANSSDCIDKRINCPSENRNGSPTMVNN